MAVMRVLANLQVGSLSLRRTTSTRAAIGVANNFATPFCLRGLAQSWHQASHFCLQKCECQLLAALCYFIFVI
jgi:hypothetical protein